MKKNSSNSHDGTNRIWNTLDGSNIWTDWRLASLAESGSLHVESAVYLDWKLNIVKRTYSDNICERYA